MYIQMPLTGHLQLPNQQYSLELLLMDQMLHMELLLLI